jgi:hypothetical protein
MKTAFQRFLINKRDLILQMIPYTSDLDSNFALEVYCVNGNFLAPRSPCY